MFRFKHSSFRLPIIMARKRASSTTANNGKMAKRPRPASFTPRKVASAQNAAAVDANPPLAQLLKALKENQQQKVNKNKAIVYWMRLADLRSTFFKNFLLQRLSFISLRQPCPFSGFSSSKEGRSSSRRALYHFSSRL